MAQQHLNKIFLSASIPKADRPKKYLDSADIVAIRDAVRALATVVIPKAHLVWGGHPSITPLIRFVMDRMNAKLSDHITLYQSLFYESQFPADNSAFENVVLTERKLNLKDSMHFMRERMMNENKFSAGIFIGGMEGIDIEYKMFKDKHPQALILPVASTGAAAKILYEKLPQPLNVRLQNDYAYMSLFRDLLSNVLSKD